jgi:hypothetical protein
MLPMKTLNVSAVVRTFVLILSLFGMPLAAPALAQNTTSTQEGGGGATTQTTRTTTTTQTKSTWLDPFWLVLGGIALLAIILIIVLASRGRGRDRVATAVHERETIIKKE